MNGLVSTANSLGWVFPNRLDLSIYKNTEWCRNYIDSDKCGGRMYPIKETDYNALHPELIFYKLRCEICDTERWSRPKPRYDEVIKEWPK